MKNTFLSKIPVDDAINNPVFLILLPLKLVYTIVFVPVKFWLVEYIVPCCTIMPVNIIELESPVNVISFGKSWLTKVVFPVTFTLYKSWT